MAFPNDTARFPSIEIDALLTIVRPVGSIIHNGGVLWRSISGTNPSYEPIGGGPVFFSGIITMAAQSVNTAIQGVLATDIGLASVTLDDSGGPLGGIQVVRCATNLVVVVVNNAVTNNDGEVRVVIFRP